MTAFDLVFALFGLLLGLAVAEVLGGFARVLKLKRAAKPVRVGWLTPLLGLFVILDLTSFWGTAYNLRNQMDATYLTLAVVLAIVGVYYMAASLIFPDAPEEWPDFDLWYDRQNRMVIGGLLFANILSLIGQGVLETIRPSPPMPDGPLAAYGLAFYGFGTLALFGLLIALLFIDNRRWNVAMLAVLDVLLLTVSIVEDFV